MSLRPVQLVEEDSGERVRIQTVVGVDESGNPAEGSAPFVFAAVCCPRNHGELLAKRLIECGLNPWQNKSQSLATVVNEREEQTRRVEDFISAINSDVISWSAIAGWQQYNLTERAAVACMVTSKALTVPHRDSNPDWSDAVLLHDGGQNTYGSNQRVLREQATSTFDVSFQSNICSVFVSSLKKGDLTYPELVAADFLAGYVRERLTSGYTVSELPVQVSRIDTSWTGPKAPPLSLHRLRTASISQTDDVRTRITAWINGRRPVESTSFTNNSQYERLIERLNEETVKSYLYSMIS